MKEASFTPSLHTMKLAIKSGKPVYHTTDGRSRAGSADMSRKQQTDLMNRLIRAGELKQEWRRRARQKKDFDEFNKATFIPKINNKSRMMVKNSTTALSDKSKKLSASPVIDAYIRIGSDGEMSRSPAPPIKNKSISRKSIRNESEDEHSISPAPPMKNRSRSRKSDKQTNSLDGTQKIGSTMRNNERIIDFRNVQRRAT